MEVAVIETGCEHKNGALPTERNRWTRMANFLGSNPWDADSSKES